MCVGDEKTLKCAADVVEPSHARPFAMGLFPRMGMVYFHSCFVDGTFSLLARHSIIY